MTGSAENFPAKFWAEILGERMMAESRHTEEDIRVAVGELRVMLRARWEVGEAGSDMLAALRLVELALIDLRRIAEAVDAMESQR